MTETELYTWLCSFIDLERGLGGKPCNSLDYIFLTEEHFKLDRMRILAELAGHPETCAPVIHAAGSKGKGSVIAMTASILEEAGIKTARYMSPHVKDWRERICRGTGAFFPEAVYAAAGKELQSIYNAYCESRNDSGDPTFFELATMLFFLCARIDHCKAMAVETGLGGRLDATNIVDPSVSVITAIEKEHTEYLGNTLAEIAHEKAGIIKKNRPVVAAKQNPEVLSILQQRAEEQGAPFVYAPDCMNIVDQQLHREGMDYTIAERTNIITISGMPLTGMVYADNAAPAILAARRVFSGIDDTAVKRALAAVSLPARFEKVRINPFLIADGAHTPLSIKHCVETFCELYGDGGILLFGCATDKDAAAMAEILLPRFSRCIITAPGTFRASDPAAIYDSFCSAAKPCTTPADLSCIPHTAAAIEEAVRTGKERSLPVLACGSFYLAAEISKAGL
ncbi:MAG: bifunctional folylpolyglutamate synthase/dihydrofolate synthase [Treponema sp.]|nr:bifunctional folylpolyglutamate synthase/dihydrofolate synthase [Treponema sp.]